MNERTQSVPSGTVTMLFTDIEGSTLLVRQLGERYEELLTIHRRLLRAAAEHAGGYEVDTQGDAFFFVFPRAKNAVLAATAAQLALAEATWPDDKDVRVRMGIHTGEPGIGEEGYHGVGVVRAARICAAGHGGQVLVSDATRVVIEDEELHDLSVRDLGEHQLKDMPRPERIFQLVGHGLLDDFPPLKAQASPSPFAVAGREEQLADAARDAIETAGARPKRLVGRMSRRLVVVVVGALLLVGVIVGGVLLTHGSSSVELVEPNSLGAIDLKTDRVVAQVPVGSRPGDVVYGHHQLWVANLDDNTVSRVDPTTRRRAPTIILGAEPSGLAAGGNAIWVATDRGVKGIDPAYDTVGPIDVGRPNPTAALFQSLPTAVAFTPHAAWVVVGGHLARANPRTGRVVETISTGNAPAALASRGDDVWVTDTFDNTVARVDATGAITATVGVGRSPNSIAVGSSAVWVADAGDDNVKRIDPDTATVVTTISVGSHPSAIAVSAGAVWVANQYDGTVWRIDPRSNAVVKKIKVGGGPVGLAVASGRLWVSVQQSPFVANAFPAEPGGVLQIDTDGSAIDPAEENTFTVTAVQREYGTCAKLLNYPDKPAPAGARLQPEIARVMPTVSPDGKMYVFSIRRGYRFSPPSNQPVTAQSMRYTIERTLNPRLKSPARYYVNDIVGEDAYEARRSRHIAGVIAHGDMLTIKLVHAAGDFMHRISMPFFCAVPMNTPLRRTENPPIPSAGPYYVTSRTTAQTVLRRNPNYTGPRPHRLREIVYTGGFSPQRSIARVVSGQTDYLPDPPSKDKLNGRYGLHSPAAQRGHQQLFINPALEVDGLVLNTSRPLFASTRMRRAVNYAINRLALARYGGINFGSGPLSATTTDQYLPPGMPGFRDLAIYPLQGDLAKARQLAGRQRRDATLYTCNYAPCPQQAQIVKESLAAIGITVEIRKFSGEDLFFRRQPKRGEPFDIGLMTWSVDYPEPFDVLNLLFAGDFIGKPQGGNVARFDDPDYNRRLSAAGRLSGSRRFRAYAQLDADLVRDAAPVVAYANATRIDFFSARVGCQTFNPVYGMDIAALCIRR
jgi:YVTN family beta-propeller protein